MNSTTELPRQHAASLQPPVRRLNGGHNQTLSVLRQHNQERVMQTFIVTLNGQRIATIHVPFLLSFQHRKEVWFRYIRWRVSKELGLPSRGIQVEFFNPATVLTSIQMN